MATTKQAWWRRRFVVEGQIIGTRNNLRRMTHLPEITAEERTQIKHAISCLDRIMNLDAQREKSLQRYVVLTEE